MRVPHAFLFVFVDIFYVMVQYQIIFSLCVGANLEVLGVLSPANFIHCSLFLIIKEKSIKAIIAKRLQ